LFVKSEAEKVLPSVKLKNTVQRLRHVSTELQNLMAMRMAFQSAWCRYFIGFLAEQTLQERVPAMTWFYRFWLLVQRLISW
jgi:hypothetical protein